MTPAQYNGLLAAIQGATVATAGTIIMYGSGTVPSGYLPCDGSAVSRTTYATLFGVIGVNFGAGDTSTTFNVPDLRGRVPMGTGAGPGLTPRVLADKGGIEGAAIDQTMLKPMSFPVTDPGHAHGIGGGMQQFVYDLGAGTEYLTTAGNKGALLAATDSSPTGVTVASGGSSADFPVVNPFNALTFLIKT